MIIFCDKNKKLVEQVKKAITNINNNLHTDFIISDKNDIFECKKKYPNAKIVTASNPNFTMGGGLDLMVKNKYPNQCLFVLF